MTFEVRPWGWMVKLLSTKQFWLKFLRVKTRTSLQTHAKRTEWHLGLYRIRPGEAHRMYRGVFIELAVGAPDENDIKRLEDDYGRVKWISGL